MVRILCLLLLLFLMASPLEAKKKQPQKQDDLKIYETLIERENLESLSASPPWDFWRSVRLGRSKLNQNEPRAALDLLKDLPPPPQELVNKNQDFYRRLYKEALETGLEAADRLSEPRETWERRLWAYFPDLETSDSLVMPTSVRTEDKIARLHILFEKSLFETVPRLLSLEEITEAELTSANRCRALFEWGWAHQRLGKKPEAAEGYGQVERTSCEGKILERALYWKGVMEVDLHREDQAEATFKRLAERSGGQYTDDAYDRLAKIYEARNESEKAEGALRKLVALPEGDMKEKYLWEEAFASIQRQDYEKASEFLEKILGTRDMGTEARPQALYWKARISELLSKKKLGGPSADRYREILKSYPFSFYALLAGTRLKTSGSVPAIAKLKPSLPEDPTLAGVLRVVDRLNDRRAHAAAADLLDYLTQRRPEAVKEHPEAIAGRWIESGDFNRALEIATGHFDKSAFDINLVKEDPLTRALYPVAYEKEAAPTASTNYLPLPLLLGLMREESLFLRKVRSRAGAVGLMQLMPATARREARDLGVSYSLAELEDPASNIRLGSSFLREMMDRFGNRIPLAVMAYNAGPGNVSKWLGSQGDLPLDEFIEAIPFTETRGYVKRVLRSAHIYGHLLGRQTKLISSMEPPR